MPRYLPYPRITSRGAFPYALDLRSGLPVSFRGRTGRSRHSHLTGTPNKMHTTRATAKGDPVYTLSDKHNHTSTTLRSFTHECFAHYFHNKGKKT